MHQLRYAHAPGKDLRGHEVFCKRLVPSDRTGPLPFMSIDNIQLIIF